MQCLTCSDVLSSLHTVFQDMLLGHIATFLCGLIAGPLFEPGSASSSSLLPTSSRNGGGWGGSRDSSSRDSSKSK
jgi:hypothetical protein